MHNGSRYEDQTVENAVLNQRIPEYLGCTPVVLNNVVFCHQEESTWVLKDDELKITLDAIIDTDYVQRYKKGVRGFREASDEYYQKAKELEVECKSFVRDEES